MVRLTVLLAAFIGWTIGCSNDDDAPDAGDDVQNAQVEQELSGQVDDSPAMDEVDGPALGDPSALESEDDADPDRYAVPPADAEADSSTESTVEDEAAEKIN